MIQSTASKEIEILAKVTHESRLWHSILKSVTNGSVSVFGKASGPSGTSGSITLSANCLHSVGNRNFSTTKKLIFVLEGKKTKSGSPPLVGMGFV